MVDVELDIVAAERRREVCIDIVRGEARSAMNVTERLERLKPLSQCQMGCEREVAERRVELMLYKLPTQRNFWQLSRVM
jgi:hypothetical protein